MSQEQKAYGLRNLTIVGWRNAILRPLFFSVLTCVVVLIETLALTLLSHSGLPSAIGGMNLSFVFLTAIGLFLVAVGVQSPWIYRTILALAFSAPVLNILLGGEDLRLVIYALPLAFLLQLGLISHRFSYGEYLAQNAIMLGGLLLPMLQENIHVDAASWQVQAQLMVMVVLTLALLLIHYLWYRAKSFLSIMEKRLVDKIERVIKGFSQVIARQNSVPLLLRRVAHRIIPSLELEDCVIYLLDASRNKLIQTAAFGAKGDVLEATVLDPIELEVGQGIVGTVAATGKAELISDTSQDARYVLDDAQRFSELAVPILLDGKVYGVIDSEHSKKGFFSKVHLHLLEIIAALCASKIMEIEYEKQHSESRKAEMEVAKIQEVNALKYRFVSNLSHDIKTPLTLILGPAEELKKEALTPEQLEMVELMCSNGVELKRSIDQLLALNQSDFLAHQENEKSNVSAPEQTRASFVLDEQKPLVLVVEDHLDLRRYIEDTLREEFNCVTAETAEEGLSFARQFIPDLVVSDLMLPEMQGEDFCKTLKQDSKLSHIPLLILSAKSFASDRVELYKLGADNYLTKPFDAATLKSMMHGLIRQRNAMRENVQQQVLNAEEEELPFANLDDLFLREVVRHVEENMSNASFNVEMLCEACDVGRNQMQRKVKAAAGMTPVEFMRTVRLHHARVLLGKGELSVSEVAYSVGFNNLSYFTRAYRKAFGSLPSEVKNAVK